MYLIQSLLIKFTFATAQKELKEKLFMIVLNWVMVSLWSIQESIILDQSKKLFTLEVSTQCSHC